MGIHDGHRERMRRRVKEYGLESLLEHEILEYLLYFCIPRGNTNPQAHALLKRFGSFDRVLDAPEEELMQVEGIGPKSARLLASYAPVFRAYERARGRKGEQLNKSSAAIAAAKPLFYGSTVEELYVLCLDGQCRLLRAVRVQRGTVDSVGIHPREVAEAALRAGARYAILAHNHVAASAEPSREDYQLTKRLMHALNSIGVVLLDHIIIAKGEAYSFVRADKLQRGEEAEAVYAHLPRA